MASDCTLRELNYVRDNFITFNDEIHRKENLFKFIVKIRISIRRLFLKLPFKFSSTKIIYISHLF